MKQKAAEVYRIQKFATLAGVTVRTLHHYDRIGLLIPTARSRAGYRLYRKSDLARLEQIVVLNYLGLPLTQIGKVLRGEVSLNDVLRHLRQVLNGRRRHVSLTLETLGDIEQTAGRGEPDWNTFAALVKEARADERAGLRCRQHCSDEMLTKLRDRRQTWTTTLQDYELVRDVRAAISRNETPAGPVGRALAARWRDMMERFTAGDADMQRALSGMAADWGPRTGGPLTQKMREFFLEAMRQTAYPPPSPS